MMKVVPPNFGYVEEGIFRCGLPEPRHYAFLTSLGVKTCVLLTEAQDNAFIRWMQESGITILCPLEPKNRNSITNYNLNYNDNIFDASKRNGKTNVQCVTYNPSAQENSSTQMRFPNNINNNNNNNSNRSIDIRQQEADTGAASDVHSSHELLGNDRSQIINSQIMHNQTNSIDLEQNEPNYNNNTNIGNIASTREAFDVMSFPTNEEINTRLPSSHAAQFVKDNIINRKDKVMTRSFHDVNQQWLNTTSTSTSPLPPSTFTSPNSLSAVPNEQLPLSTVRMMIMAGGNTDGVNNYYNGNLLNAFPFIPPHYASSNNYNINCSSNMNRFPAANVSGRGQYSNSIMALPNNLGRHGQVAFANNNTNNSNNNMERDRQMEYEVGPQGQMTLSEPVVVSILRVLIDPIHYPLLITGAKGRYRTGIVCGCLRKLQRWNLVSILSEYRRYAGDKSRPDNEEFIELFDKDLVSLELENGRKPTILYSVEYTESYQQNKQQQQVSQFFKLSVFF